MAQQGNPFYVEPMGGYGPAIAQGIGQIGQAFGDRNRQEQAMQAQQAQQKEIQEAVTSGDPLAVQAMMVKYPKLSESTKNAYGISNEQTGKLTGTLTAQLLNIKDPQQAADLIEQAIPEIARMGGKPNNLSAAVKGLRDGTQTLDQVKGVAMLLNPDMAEEYRKTTGEKPKIGTYNPRDYTPESFKQFSTSADPGDLVRYTEKVVDIGGVPHRLVPGTENSYTPIKTTAEVAKSKGEIAKATSTGTAEGTAQVAAEAGQKTQAAKLDDATLVYQSLADADLSKIYGRGESFYPEFARSQEGIDLIAQKDQLLGMLKLGARGELKGQGPITEGEQKILGDAVTVLSNQNISPDLARSAIDRAMKALYRGAGKDFDPIGKAKVTNKKNLTAEQHGALKPGTTYMYNGVEYVKGAK